MKILAPQCFLMFTVFHVSVSVTITPLNSTISFCGTEQRILIPCIYNTRSQEAVQIRWSLTTLANINVNIMYVNTLGEMSVTKNYIKRIERGESASLILKDPTNDDTGVYLCEIITSDDIPCCIQGTVNLTINSTACEETATGASVKYIGKWAMIAAPLIFFVLNIAAVLAFVYMHQKESHPFCDWDLKSNKIAVIVCVVAACLAAFFLIIGIVTSHSVVFWILGTVISLLGCTAFVVSYIIYRYKEQKNKKHIGADKSGANVGKKTSPEHEPLQGGTEDDVDDNASLVRSGASANNNTSPEVELLQERCASNVNDNIPPKENEHHGGNNGDSIGHNNQEDPGEFDGSHGPSPATLPVNRIIPGSMTADDESGEQTQGESESSVSIGDDSAQDSVVLRKDAISTSTNCEQVVESDERPVSVIERVKQYEGTMKKD